MSDESDPMDAIRNLNIPELIQLMKLVNWVIDGETLGMELIYVDDEVIQFRRGIPSIITKEG